jgi:predicted Zn finger-like uncharacterized protein
MQVTCPNCQKSFLLDDAKLPAKPVTMKCPSCGGAIPVVPPPAPPEAPAGSGLTPGSPAWERLKREVAADVLRQLGIHVPHSPGGDSSDLEDDRRLALVCEDEALFQVAVSEALGKLGFRCDLAATCDASLAMASRGYYDLITVDNRFPDDPEGGYKILQAVNALPPDQRRKMYVAFISADLSTMDTQSAFALGANLTVSKKDIRKLDKILKEGLDAHRRLYRVFFQAVEDLQRQEA